MNVFIRQYGDDYHWISTSEEALKPETFKGDIEALLEYYQSNNTIKTWVYVVSTIDLTCRTVKFSAKEKKHIKKAMPFMLEESLLTEADDLHIVMSPLRDKAVDVVAMDESLIASYVERFSNLGIKITHCLPEAMLLDESNANWQIFYKETEFLIKIDTGECLAVEAEQLHLYMDIYTEGFATLPEKIDILLEKNELADEVLAYIPAVLHERLEFVYVEYGNMLQQHFPKAAKVWNLLSGKYAYTHEWLSYIKPWRWVIGGILCIVVFNLTILIAEFTQYKKRAEVIKVQLDESFRKAIPKGRIVDHRTQLKRELARISGEGIGGSFVEQFNKSGKVLAKHKINTLNALNYEQKKSELRIDLIVDDYDKLQAIITDLKSEGLKAEIQNRNAQGDQLRARLKVVM